MILSRKWILVASLVLSVAMAVSGTLAYMTDTDTRVNTFEMGNVDISIVETDVQDVLTPGTTSNKDAKIQNDGANDAWVWMTVTVPEGIEPVWANGFEPDATKTKTEDGNTTYTVLVDTVLAAGEATADILDGVKMDENVDRVNGQIVVVENGEYTPITVGEDGKVTVTVNAYAVQKDPFENVQQAYDAYYAQWGDTERPNEGTPGNTTNVTTAEAFENALEAGGNINLGNNTVSGPTFSTTEEVTIVNGKIDTTSTSEYGFYGQQGSSVIFNNVEVTTDAGGINVRGTAVFNSGKVQIDSMNTSPRHVFYAGTDSGTAHLTINGGEFTFNPTNLTRKGSYLCANGSTATIIVNGGTFHKPSTRTAPIQALNGATVTIYGGKFAFDPSEFVAEGYTATQGTDGYWTVAKN